MQYLNITLAVTVLAASLASSLAAATSVEDAINKPGRLEADITRDGHSHPEVTLPLLELQSGDRGVADIFGGGYYSDQIAALVGDGEVLLLNNAVYRNFAAKALARRTEGRDLGSVTIYDREAEDIGLGENSLDAALIVMSYHELYHVDEKNG